MLKMAQVTADDLVYDLGAGDGKIAIAAARDFGAHAVGLEYDPHLARLAQCYVQPTGSASACRSGTATSSQPTSAQRVPVDRARAGRRDLVVPREMAMGTSPSGSHKDSSI
jgi:cyclopropane fatty-acyl-phospholipid synthase-like methyltransferase